MTEKTRVAPVLSDLLEHPGWDEILNGVFKSINAYRSKQQAVLNAKTSDEVVFQSIHAAAAINTLRNFIRNVYQAAEVPMPETLANRLRE